MLTEHQKGLLLGIAREAVTAAVSGLCSRRYYGGAGCGGRLPQVAAADPQLNEKCGAFVTLKSAGRLRGCIGQFVADQPLLLTVQQMAVAAATQDPRFVANRISPDQVADLQIEISVLSPLKQTDDPLSLELGKHGIYIKLGLQSGCFLPQVATETGWSREEFLSQCCQGKAGLPPQAWRQAETEVYLFTAQIIREES